MTRLKCLRQRLAAFWWGAVDVAWPYASGRGDSEEKLKLMYENQLFKFRNAADRIEGAEEIGAIKIALEKWIDAERARRLALESRLNALAGLSGGSAALLGALLGNAALRSLSRPLDVVVFGIFFYIVVQLVRAAICSIDGLRPSSVREFAASDMYSGSVDPSAFAKTFIDCCESVHRSYALRNTEKGTALQCAYRALKNAAVGVIIAIALVTISMVYNLCTVTSSSLGLGGDTSTETALSGMSTGVDADVTTREAPGSAVDASGLP